MAKRGVSNMIGQHQVDNITTLKLQPLKTNGREWANSGIKLTITCMYYKAVPQCGNIDMQVAEASEEFARVRLCVGLIFTEGE
jgi:hypothetical protein